MRKQAKRTFAVSLFLFFFFVNADTANAAYMPVYDINGKYLGCAYYNLTEAGGMAVLLRGISEKMCFTLTIKPNVQSRPEAVHKPETGPAPLDVTLISVPPHLVEQAQAALRNNKIQSFNVSVALASAGVIDRIIVIPSKAAAKAIRKAKIKDVLICRLDDGPDDDNSILKIPNTESNRNALSRAGVPHAVFDREKFAGQILATGPPNAVRDVLSKEQIAIKEVP